MSEFAGIRGAAALRRAQVAVARVGVLPKGGIPADLWFLGGDPLRPFTAEPGATTDAALTEVFGAARLDAVPEPTSTATLPASQRGQPRRSDGPQSTAPGDVVPRRVGSVTQRPRSTPRAAAGAVTARSDTHTAVARPGSGEPRAVNGGHVALDDGTASTPSFAGWLTESGSLWAGLAARGATTPVRIPATSVALAWTRPNLDPTPASAWTPSGVTALPAGETRSVSNPPSAAPAARTVPSPAMPVRSSSTSETRAHIDPPTRLAGLARWWNEAHAPDSPPAPEKAAGVDAEGGWIGDVRAAVRRPAETSGAGADTDELRALFRGLLEEALLTEARADGVEVRP